DIQVRALSNRCVGRGSARRAACWLLALAAIASAAFGRMAPSPPGDIDLANLPMEAQQVYMLIAQGGPFRYDRDGVVFGNREQLLPVKPRSYYREYTVHTPGTRNRGARRIICGGPKTIPDVCYYTDDHYQTFRRIRK